MRSTHCKKKQINKGEVKMKKLCRSYANDSPASLVGVSRLYRQGVMFISSPVKDYFITDYGRVWYRLNSLVFVFSISKTDFGCLVNLRFEKTSKSLLDFIPDSEKLRIVAFF